MKTPKFSDKQNAHVGKSIREALEDNLLEAVRRYLDMKETPSVMPPWNAVRSEWMTFLESEKLLAMQRGQVRAAAKAVLTWRNMYYLDRTRQIKEIEQEFVKRIRTERGNG